MRRHKDIIAIRTGAAATAVALHARNLSVAELSVEAWDALPVTTWSRSEPLALTPSPLSEAAEEIRDWERFDDPSVTAEASTFGVRSLTLNVTQICNLHCTYCAAGGDGTYGDPIKKISVEKTLPQISFFMRQLRPGSPFHIAFLGGEPLLYPQAMQAIGEYVLEEAARLGLRASFKVTTNGTLVNPRALATLRALKAQVVVSMDGPAELHDRQRLAKDGRGSFESVQRGLATLLEHRGALGGIGVHAVFNERNLEVEKAWDYFQSLPIDFMEFTYAVDASDAEATRVYNEQLERVVAKAWNQGGEAELLRIANVRAVFERLDSRQRLENHCGLGKSMVVVDSRNQLWTCPWTIGRAEDSLGAGMALDYDRLERHQETMIERNQCGDCWARFVCGGGCSFVHGSTAGQGLLNKKNDFCERTRFLTALAMVYYHRARVADAG